MATSTGREFSGEHRPSGKRERSRLSNAGGHQSRHRTEIGLLTDQKAGLILAPKKELEAIGGAIYKNIYVAL
jgi:hypothetical protein